jgi:hypothetical protein
MFKQSSKEGVGMSISQRKLAIRICEYSVILWLFLTSSYTAAQVNASPAACSSSEVVLQRYVDAIGGEEAIKGIQTQVADAKAQWRSPGPFAANAHKYKFKWKAPNKVAVTAFGGRATWAFDGRLWFNPRGVNSRDNTDRQGMAYQINMMYRLAADPLMIARTNDLYSKFETANDLAAHPGLCIIHAHRPDMLPGGIFAFAASNSCKDCLAPSTGNRLPDELYFDAQSGLLKTWKAREGWVSPGYVQFRFDDYREVGNVKIPFWVEVEFGIFQATFLYTNVVHNLPLKDSAFVTNKHCTTLLCDLLGANRQ